MRAPLALLGLALLAGGCSLFSRSGEHAALVGKEPAAKKIGSKACLTCHETVGSWYASASFHGKDPGCESCHGPGSAHAKDEESNGHIAKAKDLAAMSAAGKSEMCLTCHAGKGLGFFGSDHARGGVACEICHPDAVHYKQTDPVKPPTAYPEEKSGFCLQCHAETLADFQQPFRHPVEEGEVGCPDCHRPHGDELKRPDLGRDAACARCHQAETSQRVFRHPALDDGCSACHSTHGSQVPAQLNQDGNGLCLSCHLEPTFPTIEGVDHSTKLAGGARCWDCHVEVHGSDSDPSLLGRIR